MIKLYDLLPSFQMDTGEMPAENAQEGLQCVVVMLIHVLVWSFMLNDSKIQLIYVGIDISSSCEMCLHAVDSKQPIIFGFCDVSIDLFY